MMPFFRAAARALAGLSLLALVLSTVAALLGTGGSEQAVSVLAYAAIAYIYIMVGWWAYQRSSHVAAGPAFLIHASTWALLLPEVARWNASGPQPAAWYAVYALGAFLNGVSLLHFAAAIAFPRAVHRWLGAFAAAYAAAKPPEIRCERLSPDEVVVRYASGRRMCGVARGIARGVADHYGDRVEIAEPSCMLRGDAECRIHVRAGSAAAPARERGRRALHPRSAAVD